MNFPSLPTDSLYKFIALSGMAFIISSSYFTYTTMTGMQETISNERKASLTRADEYVWKVVDGVRLDHPEKAERTRELQSIDEQGTLRLKLQFEADGLKKRIDEIRTEAGAMLFMLSIMEKVGFILMPVGFFLWWWKIQRHQDAILIAQMQKELRSSDQPATTKTQPVANGKRR